MRKDKELTYMASIYMALADKTRLRLLAMMCNGEVCVGSFTAALGESQPKISRHLAYLRNAGIVDARRDGKWIHYSIHWPADPGGHGLIKAALEWVSDSSESPFAETQRPTSTSQGSIPGDENTIIYAESHITKPDILHSEYEAHNELDDFLL